MNANGNANERENGDGAGGAELLHRELVYRIVGCAMEVHRELGHGLREKSYERALCVELAHAGVSYSQQTHYPVMYRDELIDEYIPDLEVDARVIVETKAVDAILDEHIGQVLNYLKITGLTVGLVINFKHPKLQWRRVVLDSAR